MIIVGEMRFRLERRENEYKTSLFIRPEHS